PRSEEHFVSGGARGFDFEDRRGPDFLLPAARHFDGRRSLDDRARILQGGLPRTADGVRGGGAETAGRKFGRKRRINGLQWHYSKSKICTPQLAIVKF